MLKIVKSKEFKNGIVYALETEDGFLIETTDTFLPTYTKDTSNGKSNQLTDGDLGDRGQRWMIGVSTMSGCPVGCKFCATGGMNKWRNLTAEEIAEQVDLMVSMRDSKFTDADEHKINYTRMGEPFLNIDNVRGAIDLIESKYPETHHYVSTVGIKGSDFSWIKDNITLQISVHSLENDKRNWLIPISGKLTMEEMGQIRTGSDLKTTVNMTLVDESDFDIVKLNKLFDPEYFFIKLSPINVNETSEGNNLGGGVITGNNIV
jgi:adenine C2-methylase RlmN of 23S rRNA A2503 and tRNA A37